MSTEETTPSAPVAAVAAVVCLMAGAVLGATGHALLTDSPEVAIVRSINDGTHTIGSRQTPHDTWIAPGSPQCQWAAYAGVDDGQPTSSGSGTGRQSVNLQGDEQVFRTSRCGTWTSASSTPATTTTEDQ